MKIIPRDYQDAAVRSIYDYFGTKDGNPLVAMPTGTGKAVVIAMFLEGIYRAYAGQRVMVLTHVKELIQQNYEKLLDLWPTAPAGIYSAGLKRKEHLNAITFAGIASVAKVADLFGHIDLVLIDEAHLVSPNDETMYLAFLTALKARNPKIKVIGLTATPWRLGHGRIVEDGIFTDICFDLTSLNAFNWLLAQGYLSPLIPKKTRAALDTDGVHMRGGEFIASELQVAVDKQEVTYEALKEVLECGADRHHWLIFASGITHAEHVKEMLESMGVPTVVIHSKMTSKERDDAIAGFKAGKYRAAVNNNVLTTGFDFPAIDLIVVLRPTASAVLWVQMLGRGTRPLYEPGFDLTTVEGRLGAMAAGQKQNCLVLDFAGNTRRLGPINDPVVPRKKGQKGGDAPVKVCPSCATYNHASATHCCCCGAEFQRMVKITNHASTNELIKADIPVVETFTVKHITYSKHEKAGRAMLKVSYYCNLNKFEEFICIEHSGWAQGKARKWWAARSSLPMPEKVDEALNSVQTLGPATHLKVWVNKQFPEIMGYCFDGTKFGTEDASTAKPEINVKQPAIALKLPAPVVREPIQATELETILASHDFLQPVDFVEQDDIPF